MPHALQAPAVVMGEDAAFADQQPVGRHQRRQPLGGLEADLEGAQVAVVDADQRRGEFQRPLGLGLVMHFHQHVHAEVERGRPRAPWPRRRRGSP